MFPLSRLPGEARVHGPLVLLAEDDPTFRLLVAGALRYDGYRVLEAEDGRILQRIIDGVRSAVMPMPELLITDLRMPGIGGLDVLRSLRARGDATPFIVMTAFGGNQTREEVARLGAAQLLSKPFDLRELRRRVQCLVPIV